MSLPESLFVQGSYSGPVWQLNKVSYNKNILQQFCSMIKHINFKNLYGGTNTAVHWSLCPYTWSYHAKYIWSCCMKHVWSCHTKYIWSKSEPSCQFSPSLEKCSWTFGFSWDAEEIHFSTWTHGCDDLSGYPLVKLCGLHQDRPCYDFYNSKFLNTTCWPFLVCGKILWAYSDWWE